MKLENILLIAGSGRNVGKTFLACYLIEKFSLQYNITALKISPHFHPEINNNNKRIYQTDNVIIQKETNRETLKDSSRMLNAGASEVYYLQVNDQNIAEALQALDQHNFREKPIICEAASLRKFIVPGILFFVEKKSEILVDKNSDMKQLADIILPSNFDTKDVKINDIWFDGLKWQMAN